jgi:hypothetical protein
MVRACDDPTVTIHRPKANSAKPKAMRIAVHCARFSRWITPAMYRYLVPQVGQEVLASWWSSASLRCPSIRPDNAFVPRLALPNVRASSM